MMALRKSLYLLAIGVFVGSMAGLAVAGEMGTHSSSDAYLSADQDRSTIDPNAWELREAMETGNLPDRPVGSHDAVCCTGIDEPTVESGGQLFRPEIDSGP